MFLKGGVGVLSFLILCGTCFAEERNITFVLSAKNLPPTGHDDHSKLDPFVKVYETTPGHAELNSIGKTEAIFDEVNPEWIEVIWVLYKSGTQQKLRFEMKDRDLLNQDDAIGGAEVDLDDYVSKGEKITVDIKGLTDAKLTMEKTTPIKFKLSGKNLPKKDKAPGIFQAFISDEGESDPYVKCYFRKGIGGADRKYATTSTKDNTVNAEWDEEIEFGNYQPGTDQYWRFKVKDSDFPPSKDDDVGEVVLQIDPFVKENKPKEVQLQATDGSGLTGGTLIITPVDFK